MRDSASLLEEIRSLAPDVGPPGIDLSLDRMRLLLTELNNPQDALKGVVHVAGTNGKGSTIAFLKAFLENAGARVHCYTSPWHVQLHEAIQIAGDQGAAPISEAHLCDVLARVLVAVQRVPVTAFEAETAAAFLAFSEIPADFVLLETGLGGRLDATNVVAQPELTIITPISFDHMEFLGKTLTDIAREKAGILKPGVPVLVARQDDDVHGVIERYADDLNAPMRAAGRDWDAYEQHGRLVFQDDGHLRDLSLPALTGRHQLENAGLAVAASLAVSKRNETIAITDSALEAGLISVQWPGRLQRLAHGSLYDGLASGSEIWLDGGHNEAAAIAIAHAISDLEEAGPMPLYLIVGMLASKDAEAFLRPFRGLVRLVSAITLEVGEHATAQALDAEVIAGAAHVNNIDASAMPSVDAALDFIARQSPGPVRILICGSLHLAGRVLSGLDHPAVS